MRKYYIKIRLLEKIDLRLVNINVCFTICSVYERINVSALEIYYRMNFPMVYIVKKKSYCYFLKR